MRNKKKKEVVNKKGENIKKREESGLEIRERRLL
jgi:hypothetical protein